MKLQIKKINEPEASSRDIETEDRLSIPGKTFVDVLDGWNLGQMTDKPQSPFPKLIPIFAANRSKYV
jgi:hypothetical protein